MRQDTSDLRSRLRALPVFPGDLPPFEPGTASPDPIDQFVAWLEDALEWRVPLPHAATLATSSADGDVTARTLTLKDVNGRGWWFATRTDGVKYAQLHENPRAALTFLWRDLGRQVRVVGEVISAGPDASAADFLARPPHSRAAALLGTQSAPLSSREEYVRAFEEAKRIIEHSPDAPSPHWEAMILQPRTVEFWATTTTSGQIRLQYTRESESGEWSRTLLWP